MKSTLLNRRSVLGNSLMSGLALSLCVVSSGCADVTDADPTQQADEIRGRAAPVVFDTDMDFDDAAALAYLAQAHKLGTISLKAVTINNDGAGLPGSAIRHARCILQRAGLSHIPVADGSPTGVNPAAPELAGAVEFTLSSTFADCTEPTTPSTTSAPRLLRDTVVNSHDRVTILTTGPLTNLAAAIAIDGGNGYSNRLVRNTRAVYAMGGAVNVPGNLCCAALNTFDNTQETNIWFDPPSAQSAFAAFRPNTVRLIPLDATNSALVTSAFVQRLAADATTPEANTVLQITNQPLIQFGISLGLFYWWDPLAATSAVGENTVNYTRQRISVVQTGASAGRTIADANGIQMLVGTSGNTTAFENNFIDTLNGRRSGCNH